jgi:hypothetical protein
MTGRAERIWAYFNGLLTRVAWHFHLFRRFVRDFAAGTSGAVNFS